MSYSAIASAAVIVNDTSPASPRLVKGEVSSARASWENVFDGQLWHPIAVMPRLNHVIVDQSFLGTNPPTGFNVAEGFAYVGQTVTAGVSGHLVAVELNVARRPDFLIPWVLDIQEVVEGIPTGVILSSTTLAAEDIPLLPVSLSPTAPLALSVAMNKAVPLAAGQQFAIVLHPQGLEGVPGLFAGLWGGADGYLGGTALHGHYGNLLSPSGGDVHFRTLMHVPEPSAAAMLMAGMLSAFAPSFKRQRNAVSGLSFSSHFMRHFNAVVKSTNDSMAPPRDTYCLPPAAKRPGAFLLP
jgi:hypothetical protein